MTVVLCDSQSRKRKWSDTNLMTLTVLNRWKYGLLNEVISHCGSFGEVKK